MYLNYFATAAGINLIFNIFLTAFFLLTIRNKSRATIHLGIAFGYMSIFAMGYLANYVLYEPLTAYYRYISVFGAMIISIHHALFYLNFPVPVSRKVTLTMGGILYGGAFGTIFYFHQGLQEVDIIYNFTKHAYDFDAGHLSENVGYVILLYILMAFVTGVTRVIIYKGWERWGLLLIAIAIFLSLLSGGIANNLAHAGLISTGVSQIILVLSTLVAFFVVSITYINSTKDVTTFMAKIAGISLVTFLVVMAGVIYVALSEQERAYDEVHNQMTGRLVVDPRFKPPGRRYLSVYDPTNLEFSYRMQNEGGRINQKASLDEMINTSILERLRELPPQNFRGELAGIFLNAGEFTLPYKQLITEKAQTLPEGEDSINVLLNFLKRDQIGVQYHAKKIRALKNKEFRKSLVTYLMKAKKGGRVPLHPPFIQAMENYLQNHPGMQNKHLKKQVLRFLTPIKAAGSRYYRSNTNDLGTHYISYMFYAPESNMVYEAGYSYLDYRRSIHEHSLLYVWFILFILLVVLVGYRIFFRGSLISPLTVLIEGVSRVNDGNFKVKVPVKFQDEIGFLTRSFNQMVKSIRIANGRLARYADELEDRVEQRTRELRETLETVQALKDQQDGDYFLTSLILKPLATNQCHSESVKVDFFVKQKKNFEFRRKKDEIGGDICIAHSLHFQGRPYTVFLNADAMGKSIQGAGGALVLGAVFESIMERAESSPEQRQLYPEKWLQNVVQELQKVFEGFDGSMMISVFIGIVDDTSGLLYYVNAEHPWTVLYRKGHAQFIEEELHMHKLGIPFDKGVFNVKTFQLEAGDVIIAGSDGRDDILLGHTENGNRIINEDENLFLSMIEKSEADLEVLNEEILKTGNLTDDLSLIRVAYLDEEIEYKDAMVVNLTHEVMLKMKSDIQSNSFPTAPALLKKAEDTGIIPEELVKALINSYLKKRENGRATRIAEKYSLINPMNLEVIYLLSYLEKNNKNYVQAAIQGERVRLRAPHHLKNLLNLADIYLIQKNYTQAQEVVTEIRHMEPKNRLAEKMHNMIRSRIFH